MTICYQCRYCVRLWQWFAKEIKL